MDKSHGPRMHTYQSSFSGSATANKDGGFGYVGMPTAPKRDFSTGAPATEEEFRVRAKQYKKTQAKSKWLKRLLVFSILLGIIIIILGAIGLALNQRYAGRALPYTYIGDISVGGLTAAEIKTALDLRAKETTVTFTEAGRSLVVPVSEFETNFDTQKASDSAIVGFNPFNYLTRRNFTVPVDIQKNQVDGFLQLNVADKQTASLDAELIIGEEEVSIKPERIGFRTSTDYVVQEIQKQLAKMKNPVVNLNAAYELPEVTQEDLKDDLENANSMLKTDIGIKAWNTKITPSIEEKLSWLVTKKAEGTNDLIIEFDKAKVREYVFGLADKYTDDVEDEKIAVDENGSQYITEGKNGQKVKNIDKVANDFYISLTTRQSGLFAFEFEYTEYVTIDRDSVNLIVVEPDEEESTGEEQEESVQPTDDTTEDSETAEEQISLNPSSNQRGNR